MLLKNRIFTPFFQSCKDKRLHIVENPVENVNSHRGFHHLAAFSAAFPRHFNILSDIFSNLENKSPAVEISSCKDF